MVASRYLPNHAVRRDVGPVAALRFPGLREIFFIWLVIPNTLSIIALIKSIKHFLSN